MTVEKDSAYDIAIQGLDNVARLMNLSDEVVGYLCTPQRIMTVELPLRMDDGSLRLFTGYGAQHNSTLGPVKGREPGCTKTRRWRTSRPSPSG